MELLQWFVSHGKASVENQTTSIRAGAGYDADAPVAEQHDDFLHHRPLHRVQSSIDSRRGMGIVTAMGGGGG